MEFGQHHFLLYLLFSMSTRLQSYDTMQYQKSFCQQDVSYLWCSEEDFRDYFQRRVVLCRCVSYIDALHALRLLLNGLRAKQREQMVP